MINMPAILLSVPVPNTWKQLIFPYKNDEIFMKINSVLGTPNQVALKLLLKLAKMMRIILSMSAPNF